MTSPRVLFVGRATVDVIYSLDRFPSEDSKTFARAMHVAPGGPATNAAITYSLLGGSALLMIAIGGGPWEVPVRNELTRTGIELIDLAAGCAYEMPLTTVLVNETQATRTIVNPPRSGVNLGECLGESSAWNPAWGEAPRLVLTDGFHLDETLSLLKTLSTGGAAICLDGGSWKPGTGELAPLLSVAICSESFAVPGVPPEPDATIAWFAEQGVAHVAITRGSRPIVGWDGGQRFELSIEPIRAVDTTGAGDVLHGAFCYHFARGADFEAALRKAAVIATQSCRGMGVRAWTADHH